MDKRHGWSLFDDQSKRRKCVAKKTNSEIIGKDDFALFSHERAEKFIDADKLVVATGTQNIVEECRQIDENNNPTWLETIKSPVRDHAGNLIGILGMTRNITRRKMVETQLSLASQIFNNSQEGMVITDRNANIIDVNTAFTQITGYRSEEVIGKKTHEFCAQAIMIKVSINSCGINSKTKANGKANSSTERKMAAFIRN